MNRMNMTRGRVRQKQQTRQTILHAARRLLQRGRRPTMAEVAEEAGVSRMTLYRYFPRLEALLLEAPLDEQTCSASHLLGPLAQASPAERVARVQAYLHDLAVEHETEFRMYVRATMDEWLERGGADQHPLRGGRRMEMLEEALRPVRRRLGKARHQHLCHALAALMGIESLIVSQDVCGISAAAGKSAMAWAVRTLVQAALDEKADP